jgi:hypothetical protein
MAVIDIKKTTFSIVDGDTPPNSVAVKVGEGNLTYSEKKPREYIKDKGILDTVRNADQEPMEVSFQFQWIFLISDGGSDPTIEEALKQTGNASTWVTSAADTCEPYAVDVVVDYDPDCGATKSEKYTFPDFRYETLEHDLKAGTVSAQGMCNAIVPIITRHT